MARVYRFYLGCFVYQSIGLEVKTKSVFMRYVEEVSFDQKTVERCFITNIVVTIRYGNRFCSFLGNVPGIA